jgi:anti-sigma factor ChrR (cupin superfamily)
LSADKTTVQHPSDDLLERYSKNRLTEAEMAPLKEHLVICEKCRNTVVQMDLNQAAIREALKLRRDEAED